MSDPVLFAWNGDNYRSSESFEEYLFIRLPNGTLLECDSITDGVPDNLHEAATDLDRPDRAIAFLL